MVKDFPYVGFDPFDLGECDPGLGDRSTERGPCDPSCRSPQPITREGGGTATAYSLRLGASALIEVERDSRYRQTWYAHWWREFLAWALYRMADYVDRVRAGG